MDRKKTKEIIKKKQYKMKEFNRIKIEQENYIWYTLEPIHTFL